MLTYIFDSNYSNEIARQQIATATGIIAGIAVVVGIIAWIVYQTHKKRIRLVSETSELILDLKRINDRFPFQTFTSRYQYRKSLKSKAQFDRSRLPDILDEWVFSHEFDIKKALAMANKNRQLFDQYVQEYDEAVRKDALVHHEYHDKYSYFRRYEKNLVLKEKLNPPRSISVLIHKQYTSPQGRNHYHDQQLYPQTMIENSLQKNQLARKVQDEKQRERALMTDSLRYEILRRDGFKCSLCGATAADGTKLHVDHIKPISKGGKTERSNLRTLCERCNLGKGAKYDPYGKN